MRAAKSPITHQEAEDFCQKISATSTGAEAISEDGAIEDFMHKAGDLLTSTLMSAVQTDIQPLSVPAPIPPTAVVRWANVVMGMSSPAPMRLPFAFTHIIADSHSAASSDGFVLQAFVS